MNSAGSANVQNQSTNNSPKLVLRKVQGYMQMDNTSVPNAPLGIGVNNNTIPKVSAVKPSNPKPRFHEDNLRRSTTVRILNKKYLDTGGSHLSWIFWEHENLSGLPVTQLTSINLH